MPTHTITESWKSSGPSTTAAVTLSDVAELQLDIPVDDQSFNAAFTVPISATKTNDLFILSNCDVILRANGLNSIQTLTPGGTRNAGDHFNLVWAGHTTANVDFLTGTASDVQTALLALAGMTAGGISVTGPTGGPWVVQFVGPMGLQTQTAITVGTIATTGSAVLTITQTQVGALPIQVVNLKAGIPLNWFTGCYFAFPFPSDVSIVAITNTSGQQATVKIRGLYHP